MGAYFRKKLEVLPNVREVRGRGLLVGVEFKTPIAMTVKHDCLDHKLLITAVSDYTIRIVPPLVLTEADCDRAVAILHTVIKDIM